MDKFHIDSILDYLRRCGGQDTLVFDSIEAAGKARDLIQFQLNEDDIAFDLFPSIDQFENTLRLRMKEVKNVPQPAKQTSEIF